MPRTTEEKPQTFADLGLDEKLLKALTTLGYEEPTPIQKEAIPWMLAERDVLGQAATGTGKTAAFALPLLQRIAAMGKAKPMSPRALVLVPTRELAMQVTEALHRYGKQLGTRALPIYGGQPIDRQLRGLKAGVDVVIATPGRALDHLRRKTLLLGDVRVVVLDEADEMLDMGFAEDIEAILSDVPDERQIALFSATMPPRIAAIAKRHLKDPVRVQVASESIEKEKARVRHTAYVVARDRKLAALVRILDVERPTAALIFCRTRVDVDRLVETLNARGTQAEALHGGMSQEQRDRVMRKIRSGNSELLVATDVAARGLDIDHISHVVNYDVPSAPEVYVHRVGRTGRAGREGIAITLVEPREHRLLRNIEQVAKRKIEFATIPTVSDLRARQLELTTAQIREALTAGELDRFRVVVESLSAENDIVEIAMAAIKLVHAEIKGANADDDKDFAPPPRPPRESYGAPGVNPYGGFAGPKHAAGGKWAPKGAPGAKGALAAKGAPAGKSSGKAGASRKGPGPDWTVGRLFIGAGREAGLRPADLVGAICGETGLTPKSIGTIEITDRYSCVELPDEVIDDVIPVLAKARFKGKKVTVRRDRDKQR